jgi:hypothetical protein
MKALKKINNSFIGFTFILGTILCVSSCITPNETEKLTLENTDKNTAIISASNKSGSSVKMNINSSIKGFSAKSTQNGSLASTSVVTLRIVLSENQFDPFNNPINPVTPPANSNTSRRYNPPPASVIFNNLLPGKTYYIAAKAYSSASEIIPDNITEGGIYITQESIQVSPSGIITINSDSPPTGEINFNIPLKNIVGARVDVPINLMNGKMGDFKNKDNLVDKVAGLPLLQTDVDISDGGDGVIVWREGLVASGTRRIKLKAIRDYMPSGKSLNVFSLTELLSKPSVSLNESNNGIICWDYTPNAGVPEMRFMRVLNLTSTGFLTSFGIGGNYNNCDVQIQNKTSATQTGVIAYTDNGSSGIIKARALRSTNNFSTIDLGSFEFDISSGTQNSNVSLSKVTKNNYALAVWQNLSGSDGSIKARKVQIDHTTPSPTLLFPESEYTISFEPTITLMNPSVAIDEDGNGFVTWTKAANIYYRKVFDFKAYGSIIQIRNPLTNNQSNSKVHINDKGNGLITWTEAQDIYGINIFNYDVSGLPFKINDTIGGESQDNSALDFDSQGNGYIGWSDDRDTPGVKEIYGKRIVDYYPN